MIGHRWPYGPVAAAIGGSIRHQAVRLGVHDRQVYRWRSYGLTDEQADRIAIDLGTHPALVWADWHGPSADQLELDLGDVA